MTKKKKKRTKNTSAQSHKTCVICLKTIKPLDKRKYVYPWPYERPDKTKDILKGVYAHNSKCHKVAEARLIADGYLEDIKAVL